MYFIIKKKLTKHCFYIVRTTKNKKTFSSLTSRDNNSVNEPNFLLMHPTLIESTLNEMRMLELKNIARNQHVSRFSRLNKTDLITLLTSHFLTLQVSHSKETDVELLDNNNLNIIQDEKRTLILAYGLKVAKQELLVG